MSRPTSRNCSGPPVVPSWASFREHLCLEVRYTYDLEVRREISPRERPTASPFGVAEPRRDRSPRDVPLCRRPSARLKAGGTSMESPQHPRERWYPGAHDQGRSWYGSPPPLVPMRPSGALRRSPGEKYERPPASDGQKEEVRTPPSIRRAKRGSTNASQHPTGKKRKYERNLYSDHPIFVGFCPAPQ